MRGFVGPASAEVHLQRRTSARVGAAKREGPLAVLQEPAPCLPLHTALIPRYPLPTALIPRCPLHTALIPRCPLHTALIPRYPLHTALIPRYPLHTALIPRCPLLAALILRRPLHTALTTMHKDWWGRPSAPVAGTQPAQQPRMTSTFFSYRRRLPHWRLSGSTYFVRWSLHPAQPPLCAAERMLVFDALRHFHPARYTLGAHVVMDDHVHALVCPKDGHPLHKIMHSWKSFTANRMQRDYGRKGRIWQDEYFDRIVRDDEELTRFRQYIANNPMEKWPELGGYAWMGLENWDA